MAFSPRNRPSRFRLGTWSCCTAVAAFLGCAGTGPKPPPSDPSLPDVDVLTLKENAEEALKLSQENRLELQSLTARVKELETQLQTLSEQVAALPFAKIGEHERALDTLDQRVAALESRPARSSAAAPARKPMATFSPGPLPVDEAASAGKPVSPTQAAGTLPGPRKEAPKKGVSGPEAAQYQKAFNLYYARKYPDAVKAFEELKAKHPKGAYADNAEYWIGECEFALGNYAKAMVSFRKVLEMNETEKADDSQLKLGYCQLRLGDRKQAAEEFRKVVSLFPDSEYLERAKSELAKLESSGP
jgi:tol-pal system protein YbgF